MFAHPAWIADPAEALGFRDEGGSNFTQMSRRLVSMSVQLTTGEEDYTGGELRIYPGTAGEPELAQRAPPGGRVVNAVRRGSAWVTAPLCAGDAIFFPGVVPHRVQPVRSGARESLIWWLHGTPPSSGLWSARSPWVDPATNRRWQFLEVGVENRHAP